jgi:hypothetical protein
VVCKMVFCWRRCDGRQNVVQGSAGRPIFRYLSLVAFAGALLAAGPALAADRAGCRAGAIEKLKILAPDGFAVYQHLKDKQFFLNMVTCDDVQLSLATAVHESVHHLTEDNDAFPLIDGGAITRPHEVSKYFPPSDIARKFKPDDFVTTYLRPGSSSSATDFLYLLDELNAYSHDLHTAVALNSLRPVNEHVDHRDGLAALMAFMAIYAETAETFQPATWRGLQSPTIAQTVSTLWGQAEKVMASACGIPNFGTDDQMYIGKVYQERPEAALQKILGRAAYRPTECLNVPPKSASRP